MLNKSLNESENKWKLLKKEIFIWEILKKRKTEKKLQDKKLLFIKKMNNKIFLAW